MGGGGLDHRCDPHITSKLPVILPEHYFPNPGQSPHSFPQLKAEKNVGKALSVYLQQPSSQQAGFPQQVTADAACADNEMKKTAANANT